MTTPVPPQADEPSTAEPLVGVQSWPGATARYQLAGTHEEPALTVTVSAALDRGLPGTLGWGLSGSAPDAADRYRLIRSQLDEPGMTACLLTTLHPNLALPSAAGLLSLRRFAAAAQLFVQAAAAARPPKVVGIVSLGELLERYGLLPEHLAAANADRPLNTLLAGGQPLAMRTGQIEPDTVPADASTLAQVAARLGISPERLLADNRGLLLAADPAIVLPGAVTLPADTRTPYLTRTGDTLAALARQFGSTARDLVTGNADVPGALLAGIRVEVSVDVSGEVGAEPGVQAGEPAAVRTDTVAGDSFRSLHTRLAEQDAGVTLAAVADVLDRLGAVLAPDVVISCPLAVLGSGRDRDSTDPLTAVEVSAEHGCPPAAFAAANTAVLGLLQPGVRLDVDGAAVTTAEQDTLTAVLARLASDGRTPSVADLIAANATAPLFRAGGRALLPPPPATLTATVGQPLELAAPAVPLTVTLRLERAGISPAGAAPSVERADTPVAPVSRTALIDSCLTVLPTVRLATDARDELWVVSFGCDGIASARIEPSAGGALGPGVLALRPAYQQLVDFDAWIRPVTGHGSLDAPILRQFHQLDVEPWARSFVSELDRYLSEPLSDRLPGAVHAQLVDVRRRLAPAIAAGLAPLLAEPVSPPAGAELLSARAALAGIARSSLAPAYATVIAQYRAVAVSPYGSAGLPAAWLIGAVAEPGRSDISLSGSRTALDQSEAWCAFALTSADPAGATTVSIQPRQVFTGLELDAPAPDAAESGAAEPVLLRFVRPLDGSYRPEAVRAELPPADLPLPLREQPDLPSAAVMTAAPTFTGPGLPTLAEAAQWTAGLRYTHQHAAQDVITLSWAEAVPPSATPAASTALAEALAGYAAAAPELAALIGGDAEPPDGVDAETVRNAAASLAELATAVATAWVEHWPGRDSSTLSEAAPAGNYRVRARYVPDPGGRRLLDRLVVSRAGTEDSWPVISLEGGDRQLPLTPGPVAGQTREYVATEPAPAGPLALRLEWPGLRGAPGPDARISLTAERNAVLPGGPPISSAFLLISPARQIDVVEPRVRWDDELPLVGAGIAEALQNAFDALVGDHQEAVRLRIEVGYAEPIGDLRTVLPVLLIPELELTSTSAADVAAHLAGWQQATQPTGAGAQWRVSLAVLSARRGEQPILTVDQLVFPVSSS